MLYKNLKEILRLKYVENKSCENIAKLFNVHRCTIGKLLNHPEKFGPENKINIRIRNCKKTLNIEQVEFLR